jgi:hypothetical protein
MIQYPHSTMRYTPLFSGANGCNADRRNATSDKVAVQTPNTQLCAYNQSNNRMIWWVKKYKGPRQTVAVVNLCVLTEIHIKETKNH